MFGVCSECIQSVFRECSECVQSVFRVCSECVQSVFRVCSECVQSVFRVCSILKSFYHLAHLVCQLLAFLSLKFHSIHFAMKANNFFVYLHKKNAFFQNHGIIFEQKVPLLV